MIASLSFKTGDLIFFCAWKSPDRFPTGRGLSRGQTWAGRSLWAWLRLQFRKAEATKTWALPTTFRPSRAGTTLHVSSPGTFFLIFFFLISLIKHINRYYRPWQQRRRPPAHPHHHHTHITSIWQGNMTKGRGGGRDISRLEPLVCFFVSLLIVFFKTTNPFFTDWASK